MTGLWREFWWAFADPTGETREIRRLRTQVCAVRALCAAHQTDGADGAPTDADSLWPSQVLAALDNPDEVAS